MASLKCERLNALHQAYCFIEYYCMGTQANKILQQGSTIREQLTERVIRKYLSYKPQIDKIEPAIKALIRQSSAIEITNLLDSHTLTSFQVVLIFIERISTFGIHNNYIIDEMFEDAIAQAIQCDHKRNKNRHKRCWRYKDDLQSYFPPFYGVPTSLKQSILYKGATSYVGYITPSNPVPQEHPLFIQMILSLGFIPLIRTNVPPACKVFQTVNNIFGHALNPWKHSRSCGGSSGGQSGALSSGCSPFGFGSDIGGSIRIPSEWCGLASIKSSSRSTTEGNAYFGKFSSGCSIKSQLCPIVKSVDDLLLYSQFVFNSQNYRLNSQDVYLKQKPFNNSLFNNPRKLKIGYYKSVPTLYRCSKAHQRALAQTVRMLQSKGHVLQEIQIPCLEQVFKAFLKTFASDSRMSYLQELRKEEPILKEYSLIYQINSIPQILRRLIHKLILKKEPRLSFLLSTAINDSVEEIIGETSFSIKQYEKQIYQYLTIKQLDVWICPGFPLPAIPHGASKHFTILLAQTAVWNCLQYPSAGLPISTVRAEEVDFEDNFNDSVTNKMRDAMLECEGLPVGLQVNSFPNEEETVLFVMKQIEQMWEFRKRHMCPDIRIQMAQAQ